MTSDQADTLGQPGHNQTDIHPCQAEHNDTQQVSNEKEAAELEQSTHHQQHTKDDESQQPHTEEGEGSPANTATCPVLESDCGEAEDASAKQEEQGTEPSEPMHIAESTEALQTDSDDKQGSLCASVTGGMHYAACLTQLNRRVLKIRKNSMS